MSQGDYLRVQTGDGREVEVLLDGAENGFPLLYHHGTPSGAVPFPLLGRAAAQRGLRLVSYSRPGYGESTPHPTRTVGGVVDDVTWILDELGFGDFVTLGWSGGGPQALACAALLPGRCRAAATLAGVAPFEAAGLDWFEGMAQENHDEFGAALEGRQSLEAYLAEAGAETFDLTGEQVAEALGGLASDVDRAALTGDLAEYLAASFRRAGLHGTAGWCDDDLAFARPWGFDVAAITVPVSVWQGAQDRMVPVAHGRWLAAHVSTAVTHLYDDEGHISLVAQVGRILDDLMVQAGIR